MSTVETKKTKNQKTIPINLIHESKETMRGPQEKDPAFLEMIQSVKKDGILHPLLVREVRGPDGEIIYGLIDGTQRLHAAKLAGLEEVPVYIKNMSEADILETQIIANVQNIKTKPGQIAKNMKQMFKQNPLMTLADMGQRVSKSTTWVKKMLDLSDLPENVLGLIDDKKITLSNGYAMIDLAELAPDEVVNFLDRAQTLPPLDFSSQVAERVRQIREQRKKGKNAEKVNEFVAVPLLKKLPDLKDTYEALQRGDTSKAVSVLEAMKAQSALDGYKAAYTEIFRMDPISEEEGRRKFEQNKENLAAARKKAQEERDKKKADEAATVTAEATA